MNKFALVSIIIVALAGAMLSGLFSLQPNKNQNYKSNPRRIIKVVSLRTVDSKIIT